MDTEANADFPATVLIGSQRDFDYDAFAELSFVDAAAFQTFFGICQQPENAARISADEEQFLDRSRSKSLLIRRDIGTMEGVGVPGVPGAC